MVFEAFISTKPAHLVVLQCLTSVAQAIRKYIHKYISILYGQKNTEQNKYSRGWDNCSYS